LKDFLLILKMKANLILEILLIMILFI